MLLERYDPGQLGIRVVDEGTEGRSVLLRRREGAGGDRDLARLRRGRPTAEGNHRGPCTISDDKQPEGNPPLLRKKPMYSMCQPSTPSVVVTQGGCLRHA